MNRLKDFNSFINEGRSGLDEMSEFDSAFEGALGALKAGGVPAETVGEMTVAYDEFVEKIKKILSIGENIDETKPATDKEAKDAIWRCVELIRKDGAVAKIGGKYKDAHDKDVYTIEDMYIAPNGKVIGLAKEGGFIDLQYVTFVK